MKQTTPCSGLHRRQVIVKGWITRKIVMLYRAVYEQADQRTPAVTVHAHDRAIGSQTTLDIVT